MAVLETSNRLTHIYLLVQEQLKNLFKKMSVSHENNRLLEQKVIKNKTIIRR